MWIDIDWDPIKAAGNVAKHDVSFEEAMLVFDDPLSLSFHDPDSEGEERWITMGESSAGELLLVVHTWTETGADSALVRIISA